MKKKYLFLTILISFFGFIMNPKADTIIGGYYECWKGGIRLSVNDFEIQAGGDVYVRCTTEGWTNMNFYVNYVNNGYLAPDGSTLEFSFFPSSPIGFKSGFDIAANNRICMITDSKVVCPATTDSNHYSRFALFGDGVTNWRVLQKFNLANESDSSALANYQASFNMNSNTENTINNSTNTIINNQNEQFSQLQEKADEQNETSKGIWGTLKDLFSSVVSIPGKILDFLKGIFLPEPTCENTKNKIDSSKLISKVSNGMSFSYNDNGSIKFSGTTSALTNFWITNLNETLKAGEYRFVTNIDLTNKGIYSFIDEMSGSGVTISNQRKTTTFRLNEDMTLTKIMIQLGPNVTFNDDFYIMLINSSESDDYVPYGQVCTEGTFGDWFTNLGNKISGFFEKLLFGIIEGLKSLFVPTDEQLYEIINESKDLTENFGFVGEIADFFINIFTSLLGMINANGCIEFPEFSIGPTSLFDKVTFWQSQRVCLADNLILNEHIDTIRTITSIVLVSLFLGFASSKFFTILSNRERGR